MNCTRRAALAGTAVWPFALSACGRPATSPSAVAPSAPPRTPPRSAVVDAGYAGNDGAAVNGLSTYKTVAAALKDAPSGGTTPYVISLKPGRYREKLAIA